MGALLTTNGQIQCPHGGVASLSALVGEPSFQVDGGNILTTAHVGPLTFVGCAMMSAPCGPCKMVTQWMPSGAPCLMVKGMPVLTDSDKPMTDIPPMMGSVMMAGQMKFKVG